MLVNDDEAGQQFIGGHTISGIQLARLSVESRATKRVEGHGGQKVETAAQSQWQQLEPSSLRCTCIDFLYALNGTSEYDCHIKIPGIAIGARSV